jgi:hypothetical protein
MNIRRHYSLPNCALTLEGLSDGSDPLALNPPLTILVNAQCQFMGLTPVLQGGREFIEKLTQAVSLYAQQFLSGVAAPLPEPTPEGERVELTALPDGAHHRLTWYPDPALHQAPTVLDLTTIQLFDLVEALDQFIADPLALPDFALKLQPVSRRYRQAEEPLTQRAVPLGLGVVGLALSAALLYWLPIPEVSKPDVNPQPSPTPVLPAP